MISLISLPLIDSAEVVTRSLDVPISGQESPVVTVFTLEAGSYEVTVSAENILGIGPSSQPITISLEMSSKCFMCVTYSLL